MDDVLSSTLNFAVCSQSCRWEIVRKLLSTTESNRFVLASKEKTPWQELMIDNFFSWTTQNTYLFTACVKTVIDKNPSTRKGPEVIDEKKLSTTSIVSCVYSFKLERKWFLICNYHGVSTTEWATQPIIIFTKQTRLKSTGMKNRFLSVCLHFSTDFSTDESELLYYLSPVIVITNSNS